MRSFTWPRWCGILLLVAFAAGLGTSRAADWRDELSAPEPGGFPAVHPVRLYYECGWAGLSAGEVEALFTRPDSGVSELKVTAATTGLARALWKIDATHDSRVNVETLKPEDVRQKEIYRAQTVRTDLDFDHAGVVRFRESTTDKQPARHKRFDFPNLYDLQTALLYVRSQKLEEGKIYRIVVYPATNPYLATVTVLGRDRVKVKAGSYPAIRLDLRLQKVMPDMSLAPHGKFKRATAWISDDADRLPLKITAQIFVGSVWAELVKAEPVAGR